MPQFLRLRTYILRFLQTLGRYCDNYLSTPLPSRPAFTRTIKSTVGDCPGEFELLFYYPPGYEDYFKGKRMRKGEGRREKLPLLINMHGGGYTIGHASDDARFITSIQTRTPCLAVSINYRLAPEYPFPTGIEDCVSAILYIWSHAGELGINPNLTALSGFSAGAQFCFTSSYRLYEELKKYANVNADVDVNADVNEDVDGEKRDLGTIIGIITFYTPADWTKSRDDRARSNPLTKPLSKIPGLFFGMFEQAYFRNYNYRKGELDMGNPLLSPGLASEELVRDALPGRICMIGCEWDSLLVEGERWRERLKGVGKRVEGYVVEGVPHGWDKWPSWFWPLARGKEEKRDEAYKYAGEMLRDFWSS